MNRRLEKEAGYWNGMADFYDRYIEREHGRSYRRFRKIFLKYAKRRKRVLDVATGTGDIALVISKRSRDVTGVDIAEDLIEIARSMADDNPVFEVQDAYDLDFDRGSFDLVTCCNALNHMRDPERAMAEMKRVLKRRGKLVTITYAYGDATLLQRFRLLGTAVRVGRPPVSHSFTGKGLRKVHSSAGFKILKAEYCWRAPPAALIVARR